jgi:cytochrome c oxidase cbb3-type subunit 1
MFTYNMYKTMTVGKAVESEPQNASPMAA